MQIKLMLLLLYERGTFSLKNGADERVKDWTLGWSLPA